MTFNRAPNIVYNEILLLQQHAEEFPASVVGTPFVSIVDNSAFEILPDGTEVPVAGGAFLTI